MKSQKDEHEHECELNFDDLKRLLKWITGVFVVSVIVYAVAGDSFFGALAVFAMQLSGWLLLACSSHMIATKVPKSLKYPFQFTVVIISTLAVGLFISGGTFMSLEVINGSFDILLLPSLFTGWLLYTNIYTEDVISVEYPVIAMLYVIFIAFFATYAAVRHEYLSDAAGCNRQLGKYLVFVIVAQTGLLIGLRKKLCRRSC